MGSRNGALSFFGSMFEAKTRMPRLTRRGLETGRKGTAPVLDPTDEGGLICLSESSRATKCHQIVAPDLPTTLPVSRTVGGSRKAAPLGRGFFAIAYPVFKWPRAPTDVRLLVPQHPVNRGVSVPPQVFEINIRAGEDYYITPIDRFTFIVVGALVALV